MNDSNENLLYILIILLIALFLILTLCICVIKPFCETRNYIKMEMQRADDKDEYLHWKRELKTLYIAHIPLLGRVLGKFIGN